MLLLSWGPLAVAAEAPSPLILQIRVVEGEGASYPAGSRAIRGLTVEVTDEAGQPVPHAAVSFRLPESGPGGIFANGTRTEIASSGTNGRATVWGMKWNKVPGSFAIRVTAAKGETRAGAIVPQSLLESSSIQTSVTGKQDFKIRRSKRWVWLSALAAGAAGGGLAFGIRGGNGRANPAATGVNINIGNPSISVGRP